jgi:hypothetical protein
MSLPLFVPGGVEIAIVLFVSLLLFSPIVALAYLVLFRPDREADETADRVDDLEAEVADLRDRLDDAEAGGAAGDADADDELAGDDADASGRSDE